jgi:hypothetical protein
MLVGFPGFVLVGLELGLGFRLGLGLDWAVPVPVPLCSGSLNRHGNVLTSYSAKASVFRFISCQLAVGWTTTHWCANSPTLELQAISRGRTRCLPKRLDRRVTSLRKSSPTDISRHARTCGAWALPCEYASLRFYFTFVCGDGFRSLFTFLCGDLPILLAVVSTLSDPETHGFLRLELDLYLVRHHVVRRYTFVNGDPPFNTENTDLVFKRVQTSKVELPLTITRHLSTAGQQFLLLLMSRRSWCRPKATAFLKHPWLQLEPGLYYLRPFSRSSSCCCFSCCCEIKAPLCAL